jgi:hypothetical protein
VRAAIKWVEYTTQQALSINLEICEPAALAPSLAKIISLAERKSGMVSARDVSLAFDSKHRPSGQQIREWFRELVPLKYGEVTSKGQKITFTLTPHSTVSTLDSNQDRERVQPIHSKQRMGIEEMFRDCKTGSYDLEGTSLKGNRLINMILLMTLAYLEVIFQGTELRKKQVQKYIYRRKEPKKNIVDGVHLVLV